MSKKAFIFPGQSCQNEGVGSDYIKKKSVVVKVNNSWTITE